jgi:hypothetical protein
MHSSLTSSPATGASGNAFGKLLGNFNCWKDAEKFQKLLHLLLHEFLNV